MIAFLSRYIRLWWKELREEHPSLFLSGLLLVATICYLISHDHGFYDRIARSFPQLNMLHPIRGYDLFGFVVLFVIPAGYLKLSRKNLGDFGLLFGQLKLTLPPFFLLLAGFTVLGFLIAQMGSFQSYYRRPDYDWLTWLLVFLSHLINMWGWEFMNRGFLLGGLRPHIGKIAIFVQLIPFVLLHLGKPPFELYGSIVFGLVFGYYAYVTRTFIYCAVLHAWFSTAGEFFIALAH